MARSPTLLSLPSAALAAVALCSALAAVPVEEGLAPAETNPLVQLAPGLTMELFTERGQVKNPTALTIDEKGRVFVAETHRWRIQVQDNRKMSNVRDWVIDDLGSRTTNDRIALYKKWSGIELPWEDYDNDDEKIRLLVDEDGDGKADSSGYYAEGFNNPLAGTAGGIMAYEGKVWFACIPSVYLLQDKNGDGQAEAQEVIQDGFGVRVSLSGHDMNGFAVGHDGRIYWSIGDRGYSFTTAEGVAYSAPGSGAVFRCEPDGSKVERFYGSLRNPKEIAFNDRGDLFTVDNNADYGDRARVVYLVQGGEAGWQTGHQSLGTFAKALFQENNDPHFFDPPERWMAEGVWEIPFAGRPRFALPPIGYLSDGPCGLVYNPGSTRLAPEWDGHFLVADYRGTPTVSGIRGFRVLPLGGGYAMRDDRWFLKGAAVTDLDFGPDGHLFVSDYIGGWGQPGDGRIYRMASESGGVASDFGPEHVRQILERGFSTSTLEDLVALLAAPDRRVRLGAQFELEKRQGGRAALAASVESAQGLGRLHAVWGLGNLARRGDAEAAARLVAELENAGAEIRRQAARMIGDARVQSGFEGLRKLLGDEPSVVVEAGLALARLGKAEALEPAQVLALRNDRRDPWIEHAAVMIFAECGDDAWIAHLAEAESAAVRHAACLALRRHRSPDLAAFLNDADPQIASEAARAIYDLGLVSAFPALSDRLADWNAGAVEIQGRPVMAARRAMHAAFHAGTVAAAERLVETAMNESALPDLRREALVLLAEWAAPHPVDRVTGERSLAEKTERAPIETLLADSLDTLLFVEDDAVLLQVLRLGRKQGFSFDEDSLFVQAADSGRSKAVRLEALAAAGRGDRSPRVPVSLLADPLPSIRMAAMALESKSDPTTAVRRIEKILNDPAASMETRQGAWRTLGGLDTPAAGRILAAGLASAAKGEIPTALILDLVEAGAASKSLEAERALAEYEAASAGPDPWAGWNLCLEGGDAVAGEKVFREHGTAQCLRCHAIDGNGGAAGPDLTMIGKVHDRDYLLRSLLNPPADLAPGYGIISINLKDGGSVAGFQLGPAAEDGSLALQVGEEHRQIAGSNIDSKSEAISSMPPMSALLTKREIRDLVEYLATRTEEIDLK